MKKLRIIIILIALGNIFTNVSAQNGFGTSNPNKDAVVELKTINKGLLMPRVTLTSTSAASPLSAHVEGMIIYNTATIADVTPGIYYNNGNKWIRTASTTGLDDTNDAWVNDNANTQVKLGTLSNGITTRTAGTEFVAKDNGNVGIGTSTPQKKLHVNGPVQITGELNVGGTASTAGNPGTAGQVLTSNGADAAPSWQAAAGGAETNAQTVTVAAGASSGSLGIWTNTWPTALRIKIFSRNICGGTFYNEFIATGSNTGSNWVLNYVGGMSRAGAPSNSSASFNTEQVMTNPVAACSADGGGSNAFAYNLKVGANTGSLVITNNGNATRTYRVIIERLIDNY